MTIKRLLILGGAALLVAGCSADLTSPVTTVGGEAAVRGKAPKKGVPGTGVMNSMSASDSTCFANWPIWVGFTSDSTSSCGASEP